MTRRTIDDRIQDRDGILYVRLKNEAGAWEWKSTGLRAGRLEDARRLRDALEAPAAPPEPTEGVTVSAYFPLWIAERKKDGKWSVADDESRLKKHFVPRFGARALSSILPHEIKAWVSDLKGSDLAPATVINIYSAASILFGDAEGSGLIERTPFNRRRDKLPKKKRAKRSQKYATWEIERLLTPCADIPEDRRAFYALVFLGGGMRFGEAAARRLRDIDRHKLPLQKLTVHSSYSTKLRREKDTTKMERDREVPVHPLLEGILDDWLTGGWVRQFGRLPDADDLIVPSRLGRHRNVNHMLRKFKADCERVGVEPRRQHDLRGSFWSLCLDAGANKERLRWVVWGRPDGIDGDYDQAGWAAVCQDVLKLELDLGGRAARGAVGGAAATRQPEMLSVFAGMEWRGGRDSKASALPGTSGHSGQETRIAWRFDGSIEGEEDDPDPETAPTAPRPGAYQPPGVDREHGPELIALVFPRGRR